MLKAALFNLFDIDRHLVDLFFDVDVVDRPRLKRVFREHRNLSVFKVDHVAGILDDCGRVGCDVMFMGTNAEQERAPFSRRNDPAGFKR